MHDIICPHCGESFVASDVAFDLSSFVLPLLYSDPKDADAVEAVKFRFLVDEDMIAPEGQADNEVPLRTDSPGGPNMSDKRFSLVLTNHVIAEYIAEAFIDHVSKPKATKEDALEWLKPHINEIASVRSTRGANYTTAHIAIIQRIYLRFFGIAKDSDSETIDMGDANVQTVIKILSHVFGKTTESLTLSVRLHAPKKGKYSVPGTLFVMRDDGMSFVRLNKCCRVCGMHFPEEYGYYKMMPVVLLGSHYSGKTSFLLALLYTATEMAPLAGMVHTLSNDRELVAFSNNIDRFRRGEDPNKTDFTNVPVLNLLVNDVIYTFIDWPGEKFISNSPDHDHSYALNDHRVVLKARHFLCFLEPTQVDHTLGESEEKVSFPPSTLVQRFWDHFKLTDLTRLRSITYVLNKLDLYDKTNPNAAAILNLSREKSETSVFMAGRWNEGEFRAISDTTRNFLMVQNRNLHDHIVGMHDYNIPGVPYSFVPVAPYGDRTEVQTNQVIHRTRLAGVPMLSIMERDKELMSTAAVRRPTPATES